MRENFNVPLKLLQFRTMELQIGTNISRYDHVKETAFIIDNTVEVTKSMQYDNFSYVPNKSS